MAQWVQTWNTLTTRAKEVVDKTKEHVATAKTKVQEELAKAQQQIVAERDRVRKEAEFVKAAKRGDGVVLPWETDDEELAILSQDVMERILSLSLTEQNFTEVPPRLDLLPFVFDDVVATAMKLLQLDANLARMHTKVNTRCTRLYLSHPFLSTPLLPTIPQLSPRLKEEIFWKHYFFRARYLRVKSGIEKTDPGTELAAIKQIPEDDIIFKPTFVPPPKPVKAPAPAAAAPGGGAAASTPAKGGVATSSSSGSLKSPPSSSSSGVAAAASSSSSSSSSGAGAAGGTAPDPLDLDDDGEEVDEETRKELEARRKEEQALAAEVEAELDNDDLDLGDLDDDDLDDLDDDLGDLGIGKKAAGGSGSGGDDSDDGDDNDDELEAAIKRELGKK